MKIIHKILLPVLFIVLAFSLVPSFTASAEDFGLTETKTAAGDAGKALIKDSPQEIAGTVISAILSFVGVIFFLLIFYGGIRWMLAGGNDQEVEKAKQILVAATIGLIIVLSAYAITYYIGSQLAGSTQ